MKEIGTFLGKDATNNIIVVFSHASPDQIKCKDKMRMAWSDVPLFSSFIQDIEFRWSVSPDPHHLDDDRQISEERLMEIKTFISNIREIYTTRQLEENLERQKEAKRLKEEEERRRREEERREKELTIFEMVAVGASIGTEAQPGLGTVVGGVIGLSFGLGRAIKRKL